MRLSTTDYATLVLTCFLLLVLPVYHNLGGQAEQQERVPDFYALAQALHTIEERSFRRVNPDTLLQSGLKAMLSNLDAHSSFFTPNNYKKSIDMAAGEFAGVGISMTGKALNDEELRIVDVIEGGPAEQAGLCGGDILVEVAGKTLKGYTADEIATLLKGPVGSTVSVKVTRERKPLSFTLVRAKLDDRTVHGYFFSEYKVGYIALKSFNSKIGGALRSLLRSCYQRQARSIIIDLRRNTGGLIDGAVDMASLFLPPNTLIVSAKNNKNNVCVRYTVPEEAQPIVKREIPIFIVTDNFTASCSEIIAGALQYYTGKNKANVFIVGGQTFGKGSVQQVIPLRNGCALKLTTMLYFLPNDVSLQAHGVEPDIPLQPHTINHKELRWVEELYGREQSLNNHITRDEIGGIRIKSGTHLKKRSKKQKKRAAREHCFEERYQKRLSNDYQIASCLRLSQLYHLARTYCPEKIGTPAQALQFLREHNGYGGEQALEKLTV